MLNKLKGAEERFEEITLMLYNPDVISDMELYSSLLKEQKNLAPVVEKYREYKAAEEALYESKALLDEENKALIKSVINTIGNVFCRILCSHFTKHHEMRITISVYLIINL